jgi:hypothetical protein
MMPTNEGGKKGTLSIIRQLMKQRRTDLMGWRWRTPVYRVARVFVVQYTKTDKIYQSAINFTKWPENSPNGHKVYQRLPSQDHPKFTQIGIFGLKINHLATLPVSRKLSSLETDSRRGRGINGSEKMRPCWTKKSLK